jgi:hypothetical protein
LRGCKVYVNRNMYDFKHHLRKGRSAFLHASDNIEEAHSNIAALSRKENEAPYTYWNSWRPKFHSLKDVFSTLNDGTQPLEYLVLRNFDGFFDRIAVDEHTDIDIVTNDYMRMKANLGGLQYNTSVHIEQCNSYKVANHVAVGGKDVTFDIISYNNYFDPKWIRSMLARRELDPRGFYVLDDENYFYSLLYHAVAHRKRISKSYVPILNKLSITLSGSGFNVNDEAQAIERLKGFMMIHNYSNTRPNKTDDDEIILR